MVDVNINVNVHICWRARTHEHIGAAAGKVHEMVALTSTLKILSSVVRSASRIESKSICGNNKFKLVNQR